jgi:TetR/AcrR family transcriptional regulator, cholesterol catabolism regulator
VTTATRKPDAIQTVIDVGNSGTLPVDTVAPMVDHVTRDQLAERRSDPRYQRLMAVTRQAARNGYEAVSMREIAREAQMSMTTVYQFCGSKDHLIAEAHLEWMEGFRERLLRRPPRGRTAAARVRTYIRQITDAWDNQPVLTLALQRAIYSVDPGVREVRALVGGSYRSIMDTAIGDEEIADRDIAIEMLGHVIDSVIYGWVCGSYDASEGRRILDRAVSFTMG